MVIRKDLEPVLPYISRLLSIGQEFSNNEKIWINLKNNEDFRFVARIPHDARYKVEAVYCDGRDMSIYMGNSLSAINYDFSRYPMLTSIIEGFKNSWVYGNYDSGVQDVARNVCVENDVVLWSVNQMIELFNEQVKLLSAVRVTLQILKDSELYKIENGLPIMTQESNIHVSGVSGSSINIYSSGATATVSSTYEEPTIFKEILSAIKSHKLDQETEIMLIENAQLLSASHRSGTFTGVYKDFMQNVSAHITVFTPFIAGLTSLL